MIEITQEWVYEREACDCCDGWWDERWYVTINGELKSEHSTKAEAQAYVLEYLHPTGILYYESEYPHD